MLFPATCVIVPEELAPCRPRSHLFPSSRPTSLLPPSSNRADRRESSGTSGATGPVSSGAANTLSLLGDQGPWAGGCDAHGMWVLATDRDA